jgi:hypothetical protein
LHAGRPKGSTRRCAFLDVSHTQHRSPPCRRCTLTLLLAAEALAAAGGRSTTEETHHVDTQRGELAVVAAPAHQALAHCSPRVPPPHFSCVCPKPLSVSQVTHTRAIGQFSCPRRASANSPSGPRGWPCKTLSTCTLPEAAPSVCAGEGWQRRLGPVVATQCRRPHLSRPLLPRTSRSHPAEGGRKGTHGSI